MERVSAFTSSPTTAASPSSSSSSASTRTPAQDDDASQPSGPALSDLVAAAVGGDTGALESLMVAVRERAFRYARARLGRFPHAAGAAEDAAQEVCIAVLTSLSRYDERGVPFEAYVYSICARKVADVQRSVFRQPVPTDDVPEGADLAAGPEELAIAGSSSSVS